MSSRTLQPIAVVGIGCRFPGAENADKYWNLIEGAGTAISRVPDSRLDRELYFRPGEKGRIGVTYTELAGVVPETPFDHNRYPIPADLVSAYDGVHLRMLEVCCEAVKSAGMDPLSGLAGSRTGVYIGNTGGSTLGGDISVGTLSKEVVMRLHDEAFADLPSHVRDAAVRDTLARLQGKLPLRNADGGPNVEAHGVSQLVSRAMRLDGPSVSVDAACASSLICVAKAVYALQRGHLDMAIAGGCSFTKWFGLVLFSQAQSISATGTRPFDESADGLISSDGYAAVILKPLAKAQADGDPILGVIRSLAIGTDGKGKSLWAPLRDGQIRAVRKAYNDQVTPASLQYIECHATSTQVGDATEISALNEAMGDSFSPGKRIPIGSVKGNIGHTLECAGLAGMCKTLLALKHNTIPPQPSVVTPNPDIAWDEVPFYVPQQAEPWPDVNEQGVRRAAVNAFGIGGLNCHFVIDDRPEPQRSAQSAVPAKFGSSIEVKEDERVAVIGIGMIAPDALNTDEFWSLVSSGRSTISEVTPDRWNPDYYYDPNGGPRCSSSKLGAFIHGFEFDWKKHRIPPKQIQNSSPLQYMLLDASDQAFADAGLADMDFPRDRASVIVGTMFGGDFTSHLQIGLTLPDTEQELRQSLLEQGIDPAKADEVVARYREHILNIYPALKDETGSFTSSTLASRLTKTFNMRGGAWALDASDVSSLAGLQAASDLLLTGNSDIVLCASGQRALDITVYEEMGMTGRLSTGRAAPAFDADQQGTVPGEAVGVLLLKRLSDAERDGDRIRGVINGVSLAFNEQDPATAVSGNIQRLVASDASAAMRIDAVETARIANPAMDTAEVSGMKQAMPAQSAAVPVGSSVSQIGYTQTASGMISVIKAMLEIENQTVAPAVSASAPSAVLDNTGFQLPQQSAPLGQQLPAGAGRVLVSNMDSNGAVGHVLVEGVREPAVSSKSAPATAPAAVPSAPLVADSALQTLRLAANSTDELEALVASGNAQSISSFGAADKVRLGVIATDSDDVARKLPAVKAGLSDSQRRHILADNGILIAEPGQSGKHLAVVFSGQGAQYSGMLSDWIETSPAVQNFIQEANAALSAAQLPSFEFLTQDEDARLGEDVLNTQLAVLVADLAAWAALQEAGVRPDFIAGHSYGEFPALVAAGAWDLHGAILATIARTKAVMGAGISNAAMLSTTAPPETVTELMARLKVPCDIACFNAPDQTIIAGQISDLDQLSEELKAGGFASRTIRVPMPYHSRLMQPAQAPLAAALQQIPITAPTTRFISCGSNRPLETADDIRANLVAELTEPVRWETLVETLIASDTGMIIESGPRQILTRLNRRIIGARPVIHMALDARPGHAAEQQARIRLLLEMVRESASQAPAMTPEPPKPAAVPAPPRAPAVTPSQTTQTTAALNGTASHQPTSITSPETISMTNDRTKGRVTWIDATERRRHKMREAAQAKVANGTAPASAASNGAASKPSTNGVHPQGQPVQNGHVNAPVSNGVAPPPVVAPAPAPVAPPAPPQAVAPAAPVAAAPVAVASLPEAAPVPTANPGQELSRDKLESFVLDYVVEQTGYPPELVELDANLEADLGVDSIRKAQLLGEIAETFEIHQATEHINDLSLDDFPHLNSIIEFFLNISESPDAAQAAAPVAPTAPPAPQATAAAPVSSPPAPVAAPPAAPVATTPVAADSGVAIPRDELEKFAVSFVVEQTGYPEELVELDTDLEADLGIDSIRKAQLLGEIAEHYQMTSLASQVTDMSLDDFPTLNSIVEFFLSQSGAESAAAAAAPPPSPPPAPVAPAAVAPVTPAAPIVPAAAPVAPVAPAAVATPAAPVAAAAPVAVAPAPATAPSDTGVSVSKDELMKFAIAFVVEQTGYPEELVEPGADLEADLGIDSIRKAQLLGEIAEHYQMTSLASQITDLSLDDFPTLEAITDFFFEAAGCTTEHGADSNSNSVVATESAPAQETAVAPVSMPALDAFQRVPESDRVMQRYVVRAIPDPLPEDTDTSGRAFAGKVVVLGDNGDAKSLAERLAAAGSVVDIIAVDGNSEAAVAAFDASWSQQAVDHLVVMTSDSEQPADWATLRDQQMLVPYFVVQRWVQRRLEAAGKETPPAGILAAVTRLGGDFGIGRRIGNVSGGALTGLFKGVIREYGEITAKIIDAAVDEPTERVVDCLCREAASGRADIEVGNIRGQRHRLQMVAQPASGFSPSGNDMAGPWVVTGGARGITARIAAALGRTPGVKLHLMGRSPEPEVDPAWVSLDESGMKELKKDVMRQAAGEGKKPIEVWNSLSRKIDLAKSLRELRDQGLDLTYHACDVSDRESVGNMLQAVRQLHGPITGIIHGAGIEAAARFDRKQVDSVRLTVTSKVDGARWLWDQTAEDNLGYYVGFGSTSGRFGGVGQTDYSMSSDLLCRMGWQFGAERPNCRVFGIHWPPWGEVGMAARPESRFALESAGLKFVDTAEGISHLLDEFDICASDGEVAIVDRNMSEDPDGQKNDSELTSLAHTVADQIRTSAFVDGIIDYDANSVTTELSFDPVKHPVVADHMVDDTPVVPGTVLLDACLQAAEVMAHGRQITEARDFLISNGVRCRNGRPQRVRVKATRQADGSIQCVMTAEFNDQKNRVVDPARPIASVTVITGDALPAGTAAQSLPTEWEVLKQATSPQDFDPHHVGTVYHGPSMGRLKGAIINDATQGWFRIADPEGQNTAPGTDRPAILDALLQGNDLILHRHRGNHHLLRGIDRIVFHQPMENHYELAAYNVLTSDTDGGPVFSSQCFTPDQQAFVTLEGILSYQMKSRDAEIRLPSLTEETGSEESASESATPAGGSILRPMVMRAAVNKEGMSSVLTVPVDPENDSFFSQHRFRNIPFLPGVMLLEIMGEAAETLAHPGEQAISMENMRILRGVRGGNEIVSLIVRCTREGNKVSVQLFESERATKPSSEGTVVLGTQRLPLVETISEPHGDFVDFEYREDTPILHGPEMQSLRELAAWRFLGIAKLQCCETTVVDNFPAGSRCLIDPAILDGAIVACGTDAWAYFGNISEVPDSFDEIVFGTLPQKGEVCTVSFVCKTIYKKETTTYDVVLQGANQQTLMQINGFTLRRISGPPTKVDVPGQKEFPNT